MKSAYAPLRAVFVLPAFAARLSAGFRTHFLGVARAALRAGFFPAVEHRRIA